MLEERILVIGSPGSGKSTFARALGELTGLPLLYLDRLFWNADRTTVENQVFDQRLEQAMAQNQRWIMDGNYSRTLDRRLARCQRVFFLDYPVEVCLAGVRARRGTVRPDIPWVETEEDPEFMDYIRDFPQQQRPKILAFWKVTPEKKWVVFRCREQADAYLRGLREGKTSIQQ